MLFSSETDLIFHDEPTKGLSDVASFSPSSRVLWVRGSSEWHASSAFTVNH